MTVSWSISLDMSRYCRPQKKSERSITHSSVREGETRVNRRPRVPVSGPGLGLTSPHRPQTATRQLTGPKLGGRTGPPPAPTAERAPYRLPATGGCPASPPAPAPSLARPAVSVPVAPPVSVPVTMAPLALPGPRRPRELPIPVAPGVRPVPSEPVASAPSGLRTSPSGLPVSAAPEPPSLAALALRIPPSEPAVAVVSPPRVPPPCRPGPVPPAVRMPRPPEAPVSLALDARPRTLGRPSPVAPVLGRPPPGVLRRRMRGTLGTPARGSLVPRLRVLDRAEGGHPYEYGYDPGPHDAHLGTPPPSDHSGGCLLLYDSLPGLPGRLTTSGGRRRGRDLPVRRASRPAREGAAHRARLAGRAVRRGQARRVFDRVA